MAQSSAIPVEGQQVYSGDRQRKLAAAVFRMALEDLRSSHPIDRRTALHFLFKSERDFPFWCQRLEVDPVAFRTGLRSHVLGPHVGCSDLIFDL